VPITSIKSSGQKIFFRADLIGILVYTFTIGLVYLYYDETSFLGVVVDVGED
jgi:hypothetical protein